MATGNTLVTLLPHMAEGILGSKPEIKYRNNHPYLAFDDGAQDAAYFTLNMPDVFGVAATGIDVILCWAAKAVVGDVRWEVAIERNEGGGTDMDVDAFAAAVVVEPTAPTPSGELLYTTAVFTLGAVMDSLARLEQGRIRIARAGLHANDTMLQEAQLYSIRIDET